MWLSFVQHSNFMIEIPDQKQSKMFDIETPVRYNLAHRLEHIVSDWDNEAGRIIIGVGLWSPPQPA